VRLGHLGDCRAVGDQLEPAQRLGLHIHDDIAWIAYAVTIGRMGSDAPTLEP
jgi:hypothetical protein